MIEKTDIHVINRKLGLHFNTYKVHFKVQTCIRNEIASDQIKFSFPNDIVWLYDVDY